MYTSVSGQMGAAQCWSCAKAKWVSCSPLPVATGEEELGWGFSATDFKTQVVWVKQGCQTWRASKTTKKKDFVILCARCSWMFPDWQSRVSPVALRTTQKPSLPEQLHSWFIVLSAQVKAKSKVSPSTTS